MGSYGRSASRPGNSALNDPGTTKKFVTLPVSSPTHQDKRFGQWEAYEETRQLRGESIAGYRTNASPARRSPSRDTQPRYAPTEEGSTYGNPSVPPPLYWVPDGSQASPTRQVPYRQEAKPRYRPQEDHMQQDYYQPVSPRPPPAQEALLLPPPDRERLSERPSEALREVREVPPSPVQISPQPPVPPQEPQMRQSYPVVQAVPVEVGGPPAPVVAAVPVAVAPSQSHHSESNTQPATPVAAPSYPPQVQPSTQQNVVFVQAPLPQQQVVPEQVSLQYQQQFPQAQFPQQQVPQFPPQQPVPVQQRQQASRAPPAQYVVHQVAPAASVVPRGGPPQAQLHGGGPGSVSYVDVVSKVRPDAPTLYRVKLKGDISRLPMRAIKGTLEACTGVPVDRQVLEKDGFFLADALTGEKVNLVNGSVLTLTLASPATLHEASLHQTSHTPTGSPYDNPGSVQVTSATQETHSPGSERTFYYTPPQVPYPGNGTVSHSLQAAPQVQVHSVTSMHRQPSPGYY